MSLQVTGDPFVGAMLVIPPGPPSPTPPLLRILCGVMEKGAFQLLYRGLMRQEKKRGLTSLAKKRICFPRNILSMSLMYVFLNETISINWNISHVWAIRYFYSASFLMALKFFKSSRKIDIMKSHYV